MFVKYCIAKLVTYTDAIILTKLFPIKIVAIILSRFFNIFSINLAFLFPLLTSSLILASDTAVKAVSELEKKAEHIIRNNIIIKKIESSLINYLIQKTEQKFFVNILFN